jgi:hypothetical protein
MEFQNFSIVLQTGYNTLICVKYVKIALLVVDIKSKASINLIHIYRWFNPQEGISAKSKFLIQLELISRAIAPKKFFMGDFNIDHRRKYDIEYHLIDLLNSFDEILGNQRLVQKYNFLLGLVLCSIYTRSQCWTTFIVRTPN